MSSDTSVPPAGRARFATERSAVTAGTYETITIEYSVGRFGMDDGSSIGVVYSQTSDASDPQTDRPADDGYVTVSTTGDGTVTASVERNLWKRPFAHGIRVDVTGGSIDPGERITLVLGDRSAGSLGYRQQSFVERDYEFRVLADPVRTGEFVEAERLSYDVSSAPATRCEAVLPSTASAGESAQLQVRAMDRWGNIDRDFEGSLSVEAVDGPHVSLEQIHLAAGVGAASIDIETAGVYRLEVGDADAGIHAMTNPLVVDGDVPATYWGDIHGQSGETVGTGTIQEYFTHARDCAFVDFASHAGNDFQITDEFWATIRETVRAFHEPGSFVTFPCYEWSGNTPAGGDHNVYFRDDEAAADQPILRSHSWLITNDEEERAAGTSPIQALYDAYEGRDDVLIIPHQGGRPAALDAYDPDLTPFVEIVSVWGVFEWFGRQALDQGWEVAFVGGSDDHTGRPGIATPDNLPQHNVRGGLLAARTPNLDREGLWEAFTTRSVYGSTGARILLDVEVDGAPMGAARSSTAGESIAVDATVHGTAPISTIQLYRDGRPIDTADFADDDDDEDVIEISWCGATGTGRDKLIRWDGGVTVDGGRIESIEGFGFPHPDHGIRTTDPTTVTWQGSTSGNRQGIRLSIDDHTPETEIRITTAPARLDIRYDDLGATGESIKLDDALDASLTVRRTGRATRRDVTASFEDELPEAGAAYHLRVTQSDGEMAWSSPTYLTT